MTEEEKATFPSEEEAGVLETERTSMPRVQRGGECMRRREPGADYTGHTIKNKKKNNTE